MKQFKVTMTRIEESTLTFFVNAECEDHVRDFIGSEWGMFGDSMPWVCERFECAATDVEEKSGEVNAEVQQMIDEFKWEGAE